MNTEINNSGEGLENMKRKSFTIQGKNIQRIQKDLDIEQQSRKFNVRLNRNSIKRTEQKGKYNRKLSKKSRGKFPEPKEDCIFELQSLKCTESMRKDHTQTQCPELSEFIRKKCYKFLERQIISRETKQTGIRPLASNAGCLKKRSNAFQGKSSKRK